MELLPGMKWMAAVWFAWAFLASPGFSQPQPGRQQVVLFESLSLEQGLSQGMINHIFQDKKGFMWFATKDGLNRYDGYTFLVYRHKVKDSLSLANNYVTRVFEDSRGFLWVGTSGSGLDLFDPRTETFTHFKPAPGNPNRLQNPTIQSLAEDRFGRIWIGTSKGLYTLELKSTGDKGPKSLPGKRFQFQIRHISLDPDKPNQEWYTKQPNADYELQNMHLDREGRVWVSSFGRFFRIHPAADGRHRIENLPVRDYIWFDQTDKGMERHAHAWVEDTLRKKLYTLSSFSISEMDMETGQVRFLHKGRMRWGDIADQAVLDREGYLWFAESGKLFKIQVQTGESLPVQPQNSGQEAASFFPNRLFLDRGGVLWIGSRGLGLWKYNVRASRFHFHPVGSMQWMHPFRDSLVAMVTADNTILIFNSKTDRFQDTLSGLGKQRNVPGYAYGIISSLLSDPDGSFWMTKSRLLCYWPGTTRIAEFRDRNQVYFPLFQDRSGDRWVGTDQAFCRIRTSPLALESIPFPFPVLNWPYTFIQCVFQDADRIFWLGTSEGLLRLDARTKKWTVYRHQSQNPGSLSFNLIFCLCPDPAQPSRYLWIGTNGGGLNRFDVRTGQCERIGLEEGLPNNVVYGIESDAAGFLWISTNSGLCRMDPRNRTFKNFRKADGLQGDEFNRYAHCRDGLGNLFFGGIQGFNYFKPNEITDQAYVPGVVLTDIRVMNKSLEYRTENAPLKAPPFLADEIELGPDDKVLSLDFSTLDFSAPGKNQFRYKLEGFDKAFVEGGTRPTVTYTNLDPGTYAFQVLGSNPDGVWGKKPLSLRIVVHPPWYQTWWFRVLAAAAFFLGVYGLYLLRLNQALRLQALRNHIARDLHDEIGSNLSNISIFTDLARTKAGKPADLEKLLSKIQEYTQISQESMGDIVWMVNARNDRLDHVLVRMRSLAGEWCESRGIQLDLEFTGDSESIRLNMLERKNFWLLFKEALNNAIKYSRATVLRLRVEVQGSTIFFQLHDNGIGFDPEAVSGGNGLGNMAQRAQTLGGKWRLDTAPGKGTSLEVSFSPAG